MGKSPNGDNDNRNSDQPGGGGFRTRAIIVWLLIAAAVVALLQFLPNVSQSDEPKSLNTFYEKLESGLVVRVDVEDKAVIATMKDGTTSGSSPAQVKFNIPADHVGDLLDYLRAFNQKQHEKGLRGVEFTWRPQHWSIVFMQTYLPWLLMLGLLWFLLTRAMRSPVGGGVLSFGKSRARLAKKHTGVTFDDVAGIDEAKEEVNELIEFLRNPTKFERLGGHVPRGVLLIGAPGTGKTLLAKAIAGEADRPFFSISGSDFVEMFVGVGASRVRDLFRQAKENAPCIIFLDEIDAVGRRRGTGIGGGHDEREQTLNAILVEMDGFDSDDRVILIAATNRPDVLDPALLRPGRFDRQIVVDPPDINGREAILKVHTRNIKVAPDIDMRQIARGTTSFSGADLANLVNEAAIIAVMKGKEQVEMEDFESARDKVHWGREKKTKAMSEDERRTIAIHEGGHAIVGKLLEPVVDAVHKVAIIPRGMALGATMYLPKEDTYLIRREKLLGNITVALAGRTAEELVSNDITTGAQNDLEVATELARLMVCKWGMTKELGPINYSENEETLFLGREITKVRNISEDTSRKIDAAIREIVDQCSARARELLGKHQDALAKLADALLEYETLDGHDVELILQDKPLEHAPKTAARHRARQGSPAPADAKQPTTQDKPLPEFREGVQPA